MRVKVELAFNRVVSAIIAVSYTHLDVYKRQQDLIPGKAGPLQEALDEFHPDLLHLHSTEHLGLAGLSYAREHKIPAVTTFHSLSNAFTGYGSNPISRKVNASKSRSALSKILQGSRLLTTTSPLFQGLLKQHGFNYQLEGIPLCVDQRLFFYDRYDQNSGELLSKYSLSSSTKFFIYVGTVSYTHLDVYKRQISISS